MAPSSSRNGATRSSARIRILAHQGVRARFLNPQTGDRPRTRAEKAALNAVAGRRSGNILDQFTISKPGSNIRNASTKLTAGAGLLNDDFRSHSPSTVEDDDDNSVCIPRSGRSDPGLHKSKFGQMPRKQNSTKRRRLNTRSRAAEKPTVDLQSEVGHPTPDWLASALHLCWPEIFRHAAADSFGLRQGWLLQAATVCKALAEPALDVLYSSPQVTSDNKMQKLIATLSLQDTMFYYRSKVRSLHLGPEFIPKDTMIKTLVSYLPRLKHFSVTHELDQPPYRRLELMGRKTHPDFWTILDDRKDTRPGMNEKPSQLLSWKWSGRLLPDFLQISEDVVRLHSVGPLRDIKKLHLVNFPPLYYDGARSPISNEDGFGNLLSLEGPTAQDFVMKQYEKILNSPQHLEHLVLEACWATMDTQMLALPPRLKHLELTHCWNLSVDDLSIYLAVSGKSLTTLVLNNNSALDLDFLTGLRELCPNLEKLVVNMAYYRDPDMNSPEPQFECALTPGRVPTWPSSLRHIELVHVRQWDPDAAVMLFKSLIDSARLLPNLRHLVLKTMLDLDWRRRAALRTEWERRLQDVFLRAPSKPPSVTPAVSKPAPVVAPSPKGEHLSPKRQTRFRPPTRRSGRISEQHSDDSGGNNVRKRLRYEEPPSDPEDDDADGESSDGDSELDSEMSDGEETKTPTQGAASEAVVQGLCEHVELTIENHKLAEVLFDMDDFVDASQNSEMSDPDFSD